MVSRRLGRLKCSVVKHGGSRVKLSLWLFCARISGSTVTCDQAYFSLDRAEKDTPDTIS